MSRTYELIIELTMLHAFFLVGVGVAVGSGLDMLPSMNLSLSLAIKAAVTTLFQI